MVSMEELGDNAHVAVEVALGPLGHALTAPANKHVLGQAGVCVLDLDKSKLDLAIGQVLDHVNQLALAGGLDLEDGFLAGVWLEGIGEWGLNGEDGPLSIGGRVGSRAGGERSVDDLLVGGGDGHAVAGGVERGHGGREDSLQWGRKGGRGREGGRKENGPVLIHASTNAAYERMGTGMVLGAALYTNGLLPPEIHLFISDIKH